MRREILTVKKFIDLLLLAPPDAVVFGEFEGGIYPLTANEVRIGRAHESELIAKGESGRAEAYTGWSDGDEGHDRRYKVLRCVDAVLPAVGQSGRDFPTRLDGEPAEIDE